MSNNTEWVFEFPNIFHWGGTKKVFSVCPLNLYGITLMLVLHCFSGKVLQYCSLYGSHFVMARLACAGGQSPAFDLYSLLLLDRLAVFMLTEVVKWKLRLAVGKWEGWNSVPGYHFWLYNWKWYHQVIGCTRSWPKCCWKNHGVWGNSSILWPNDTYKKWPHSIMIKLLGKSCLPVSRGLAGNSTPTPFSKKCFKMAIVWTWLRTSSISFQFRQDSSSAHQLCLHVLKIVVRLK